MNARSIFVILTWLSLASFGQNQANMWHFNRLTGLDFNTGQPVSIIGPLLDGCASTMSDTSGNLLFTSNANTVWNRSLGVMQNGEGLMGHNAGAQSCLIVQKPGSDHLYYVFTAGTSNGSVNPPVYGLYYSVVDMTLDNGMGAVTDEKNIPLTSAWDAVDKIHGVRHANGKDIWIITYKHKTWKYAAYLLTESGIEDNPVISDAVHRTDDPYYGGMTVSFDKKYLIATFQGRGAVHHPTSSSDICKFNANTGEIEFLYALHAPSGEDNRGPKSVAFAPDSKLVYISYYYWLSAGTYSNLYQYDVNYIESEEAFTASAILITEKGRYSLQLARDGKIYSKVGTYSVGNEGIHDEYITIIHEPWKRGTACNYEDDAISVKGYEGWGFLPNMLLDYLYRFEWEGRCRNEPFVFQPNFIPEPSFIEWKFGDPLSGANISHEMNPSHTFSSPGEYEVFVHVEYPGGRVEETSRLVTVVYSPQPDLGEDIFLCEAEETVLNAGSEQGFYSWSNGSFGQNVFEITVADTGTYWVRVENDDCVGYDTIHVGLHPPAMINEENLAVVPTGCGGQTGEILGLAVDGANPLSFAWYDAGDSLVGNTLDISGLGVGNYFLHIVDGNGCETESGAYTIIDAGDVSISDVAKEDTHCGQHMGSIVVTAASPGGGELLYSIDNGNTWHLAANSFENLPAGSYFVRVKDQYGCERAWESNPVVVESIDAPVVTGVNVQADIDYLSNGVIDIQAAGFGGLSYSIDNGGSFQNNGLFTNLSAGLYYCVVKDSFGCDTAFSVEVELVISQLIDAMAGNGYTCIGNATVVPLKLNNFSGILKFNVTLTYDALILSCEGFIQAHPLLEDNIQVSTVPGSGTVVVAWQGDAPVSLEENATMLELVFNAGDEGFSTIDWDALPGESAFYNAQLDQVNAQYHLGSLRIYKRPGIIIPPDRQVCDGEYLFMSPFVSGGTGEVSYLWEGPNGFISNGSYVEFEQVAKPDAGTYLLTVTDTIDCMETAQVQVSVYDNPQSAFPGADTIFEQPGFILDAGSGYQNYLWNTGDTTGAITIDTEGLYWVRITSQKNCSTSDSLTVLWEQQAFYLPNAFTPDGDGMNDVFKPLQRYDMVSTFRMQVYNRWGEMIFETGDINRGWDGTFDNKPAPQGSYVYKIVYTAWPDKDKQQVVTGMVILVR